MKSWLHHILNPPTMGPRDRTRPQEANEIGAADLCRTGLLMMMIIIMEVSNHTNMNLF